MTSSPPTTPDDRTPAERITDSQVAERTVPRALIEGDAPPPACDPAVWMLHVRFQRRADQAVLDDLVEEYRPLALSLARRMHRGAEPIEDLQQVALETLLRCLHNFDCDQSTPFVGYAAPAILGALKRHYRDQGWSLRIPRRAHELAGPARDTSDRLAAQLGRVPTLDETATEMGVDARELEATEAARRARGMVRLDAPLRAGEEDGPGRDISVLDGGFDEAEGHIALTRAMETLGERDRTVLGLYFFEEQTQTEIAKRYGVSQMQVSRWIRSSLARLRSRMEPSEQPLVHC